MRLLSGLPLQSSGYDPVLPQQGARGSILRLGTKLLQVVQHSQREREKLLCPRESLLRVLALTLLICNYFFIYIYIYMYILAVFSTVFDIFYKTICSYGPEVPDFLNLCIMWSQRKKIIISIFFKKEHYYLCYRY